MNCLQPLLLLVALLALGCAIAALMRVRRLEAQLKALSAAPRGEAPAAAWRQPPIAPAAPPWPPPPPPPPLAPRPVAPKVTPAAAGPPPIAPPPLPPVALPTSALPAPGRSWAGLEELLGARLLVWVGSLALALAGAFLVKVSFARGWISPPVRVTVGILFGLALLIGGEMLRRRLSRIPQALSAAGIADLFACFLAAVHLYALIPPSLGFALMGLTALVAVGLSIRQGPMVALIGLVGGFLTPGLIQTGAPDARNLFAYLFLIAASLMMVAARRGWWALSAAAVAGGLAWVVVWMAQATGVGGSAFWLSLFLLALAALVAVVHQIAGRGQPTPARAMLWLTRLSGAAILFTLAGVAAQGGYSTEEWAFLLLLAAATLFLAWREPAYQDLAWVAAVVIFMTLAIWLADRNAADQSSRYTWTTLAGGLLFVGAGWLGALAFARWPTARPRPGGWASLATSAVVVTLLLAREGPTIPGLHWGVVALGGAAVFIVGLIPFLNRRRDPGMEAAAAALAVGVTTLAALAATLELDPTWITLAWAFEVLAVVELAGRFRLPALPTLAQILALGVLCRVLLNPPVLSYDLGTLPIWNGLLALYGVPLVLFLLAAYRLDRQGWHGPSARGIALFEWGAFALGIAGITLEVRQAFHPGSLDRGGVDFAEAGSVAVAWLIVGWALLRLAWRWPRRTLSWGGTGLVVAGVVATVLFPGLLVNPLWHASPVGSTPIFNFVLVTFGGSALFAGLGALELRRRAYPRAAVIIGCAAQLFAFALVTLEVRQAFRGSLLNAGVSSAAEGITYSVSWITLGLVLLVAGLLRRGGGRALRFGSLAVMLLAIGKVFLYDTAHLSDLYRVASFFGLGASLLLLAFLYQRFVFRDRPKEQLTLILCVALIAARAQAAPAPPAFETQRAIVVPAAGWVRVPLDLPSLRHLEGGLHLIGPSGEELPLRLTSSPAESERRPLTVTEVREEPDGWVLRLDAGPAPPLHERLFLAFSRLTTAPAVTLEASTDGQAWEPLATGDLFRLGKNEGLERTELAYAPTAAEFLRLRWPRAAGFPQLESVEAETTPGHALVVASMGAQCRVASSLATVCRLPLPAAGLTLRHIHVDVRGGGDVGYRVYQPQLATWQPLLAGVWHGPGGAARHTLSPSGEPLAADLLRLELNAAAGPPPQLTGYGLEIVPQTVIFKAEQPGRYLLAYGGFAPPAPVPGGATPTGIPEGTQGAAWIKLGPEEHSGKSTLPEAAIAPGGSLPTARFRASWEVARGTARAGDLVRLDLPDDVYAQARPDLGDLRLVVNERQLPYVRWTPPEPVLVIERQDLAAMAEKGRRYSRLELSLPQSGLPLTDLFLTAPAAPLERPLGVRYPAPGPAGLAPREERVIGRETWQCMPQPPLPCRVVVPLSGPANRQLALRFADGDNPPIPHLDVALWRRGDVLFFVWPGQGPVRLMAGNDTLTSPVYDLAALADSLPGQSAVRVVLTSGGEDTGGSIGVWSRWILPISLALAAALLLLLLQRILRSPSGDS